MLILGLSLSNRDAAAALMRDGAIEAAMEDYKLQPAGTHRVPEAAIRYCLAQAHVEWSEVDRIAIAADPLRRWARRAFSRCNLSLFTPLASTCQQGRELGRLARQLTDLHVVRRLGNKAVTIDPRCCSAASAYYESPFARALVLTLDGAGGMVALGDGSKLRIQETVSAGNSIGWLYARVTEMLGFGRGEEHKTQWRGLEGAPIYKDIFLRMLRRPAQAAPRLDQRRFRRDLTGDFAPTAELIREFGLAEDVSEWTAEEKRDIASSLQAAITEAMTDWLAALRKKFGRQEMCLAGGVFQNTLLVSALERSFGASTIFVPPAPGNAGCATGAAAWLWHQQLGKPRSAEVRSVFWGPSFTRQEIKDVLDNVKSRYVLHNTDEDLLHAAVRLLAAGKIVGWFQGSTEFGPRALGHRSILASPWAAYVTENLNEYVKHRESFRPYAVSIREEDCARYFEASPLCRFMNSLAVVQPEMDVLPSALQLPGGLVRLHIVEKQTNRLLWELLRRFGQQAPAPILVNTSFNLPNEPPVVQPRDAVRTFFCSGTEALFIDRFLLTKWSAAYVLNERAVARTETAGAGMQIARA